MAECLISIEQRFLDDHYNVVCRVHEIVGTAPNMPEAIKIRTAHLEEHRPPDATGDMVITGITIDQTPEGITTTTEIRPAPQPIRLTIDQRDLFISYCEQRADDFTVLGTEIKATGGIANLEGNRCLLLAGSFLAVADNLRAEMTTYEDQ